MEKIEIVRERNKIREELAEQGIYTLSDFKRPGKRILYTQSMPGHAAKEVGYMTTDNRIVMY